MSKTTPVRWWRDDEARYQARPLIGVCRTSPSVEPLAWAFELLAVTPEQAAALDELRDLVRREMLRGCAMPPEVLNAGGSGSYALARVVDVGLSRSGSCDLHPRGLPGERA